MQFIDEKGRIFGRVNIIDALVVLFALAIIVAGVALVFGADDGNQPSPEPNTTDQPEYRTLHVTVLATGETATRLESGNITTSGTNATVTDVYRTPGPRVYLRVALNGTETDDGFLFAGNPVRVGDRLGLATETTTTGSTVVERDTTPAFQTDTTSVLVQTTVRTPVADAVAEGDQQFVGDTPVATVTDVDRTRINETNTRLEAGVDLETRSVDGTPHYGGRPVRLGRTLVVATDNYEFQGEIVGRE
jgi:hypothetical protein